MFLIYSPHLFHVVVADGVLVAARHYTLDVSIDLVILLELRLEGTSFELVNHCPQMIWPHELNTLVSCEEDPLWVVAVKVALHFDM